MVRCGRSTKITYFDMIVKLYGLSPAVLQRQDWQFGAFVLSPMAFVGLVGNGISFFVLLRPRFAREFRSLRLHLVLLSITEILFCATYMILDVLRAAMFTSQEKFARSAAAAAATGDVLLTTLLDSCLSTRNWCIALIAMSRWEVVVRPLASLRCKLLSNTRVKGLFFAFAVFSVLISCTRFLALKKFSVCHRPVTDNFSKNSNNSRINHESDVIFYEVLFVFAFQRVIPIAFILISTATITFKLICRHVCSKNNHNFGSHMNAILANRTVLLLTAVTLLLEGVYVVYKIVDLSGVANLSAFAVTLEKTNRVFLILDSCCNAVIYVLANRVLKEEVLVCLRCKAHSARGSRVRVFYRAVASRETNSAGIASTQI